MWILKLNGFRHRYVHSIKLRRLNWYFDYLFFGSGGGGGGYLQIYQIRKLDVKMKC